MLTIAKLFGKSPFAPLQTHMDKVACCMAELPLLFEAMLNKNMQEIDTISARISQREQEADLTKNDIRNHLPRSLLLPVDRNSLLIILSLQDALADQAGKIAQHAAMRQLELPPEMRESFIALCAKSIEAFQLARIVMKELEDLLESSFGGIEAQKVKRMVEQIASCDQEGVLIQRQLVKHLYREGDEMSYPAFHLCHTLIEEIGGLSHLAEKMGNRVRMLLELK